MKTLSKDLKRMLAGLAYQDAGDYLSTTQKSRLLGYPDAAAGSRPERVPSVSQRRSVRRIALVSDGRGAGAPLDYAIDTCTRQKAEIDLLLHDGVRETQVTRLERRLQQAGVGYRVLRLVEPAVEDLIDYVARQTSLIFMVGMPDDPYVRRLMEDVVPKRGGLISVPLVLIEDQPASRTLKLSAA